MKHLTFVISLTSLLTCMTVSTGIVKSESNGQYSIGVVEWAGWSPVHVALEKGYWKELGINVQVVNLKNNQTIYRALNSKLVDIGFDMIGSAVGLYMEGKPIVVIAETNWSHGGDRIILKKGKTLDQFKGKPLGVYLNKPSVTYFLNRYLLQNKLTLSDFRIVEMETDRLANMFIAGGIGLIVAYDPDAMKAVRQGNGEIMATSASYNGCIPEGMLMLKERYSAIPANDLKKIITGWIKAADWVNQPENWEEYQTILNAKTFKNENTYSENDLKNIVNAVKIHTKNEMIERNKKGGGLDTYLTNLKIFLTENDLLKKDFVPADIFINNIVIGTLQ